MSSITWLHLSDLHFKESDSYDSDIVLKRLIEDLERQIQNDGMRPNFIILSGDIAYSGKPEEYKLAIDFLNRLLEISGLERDRLFLAPGNHDVDRNKISALSAQATNILYDNESFLKIFENEEDRLLIFRRLENYNNFLREYLNRDISRDSYYVQELDISNPKISVICFNSALLAGSDDDRQNLVIGESQVLSALKKIQDSSIKIAVMHHPFDWLKDFDKKAIEPILCKECDFILHGHLHSPDLRQISTPDQNSITIAAGACYEKRTSHNSYNFVQLDLDKMEGTIYFRMYSNNQAGFWTNDTCTYQNAKDGKYNFKISNQLQNHSKEKILTDSNRNYPKEQHSADQLIAIPTLPNPYFAHFFDQYPNFTGRISEQEMLNEWLQNDNKPIISLIAIGGMGKSSLCWYWLKNYIDRSSFDGLIWWSFYDSDSSFLKFLEEAIIYVSNKTINPFEVQYDYDKAKLMMRLLQEHKFLIIFDGFEKQLGIYDNHNEENKKYIKEGDFYARACVDHKAAYLLRSIAAGTTKTKLIITTRAMVKDLEDSVGNPLEGCLNIFLNSMNPQDAIRFMRAQGVSKGRNAEIDDACNAYGYHPLSLRLLSGLIIRDKMFPGDISVAPQYDEHSDIEYARQHILEVTYNSLPKDYQLLLSRIASLRSTANYKIITIFNNFKSKNEFEEALDELIDWGLLLFDKDRGRFDLHPIVRKYAYSRLLDKKKIHSILRDYFITELPPEKIHNIEDLSPTIDLYYHTARAEMYDEAAEIYIKEIMYSIFFRFGAYQTNIELLRDLFPNGFSSDPPLRNQINKTEIINDLGMSYGMLGKSDPAIDAFERAIILADRFCNKKDRIACRLNLARQQIKLGRLLNAEKNIKHQIKGGISSYDDAVLRANLGELLALKGDFTKSAFKLKQALSIFNRLNNVQGRCVTYAMQAKLYLFMKKPEAAIVAANSSLELWKKEADADNQHKRDRVVAEWLMGSALTQVSINDANRRNDLLSKAEFYLNNALISCRSINLLELESDILLSWAKWYFIKGDTLQAYDLSIEALNIAEKCEYRLNKADINIFLAFLELNKKNLKKSKRYAEVARDLALCNGNSYCYKPAMINLNIILDTIITKSKK